MMLEEARLRFAQPGGDPIRCGLMVSEPPPGLPELIDHIVTRYHDTHRRPGQRRRDRHR